MALFLANMVGGKSVIWLLSRFQKLNYEQDILSLKL